MNLTRSGLYLLLALLTIAVGIATNVVTAQMPVKKNWRFWINIRETNP